MHTSKYLWFLAIILLGTSLNSCKQVEVLRQDALRPMPSNYNSKVQDTSNVANINWRQFFADPLLTQLIDTALQNNLDLKIALQRIEMAQAGVLSREAALKPEVQIGGATSLRKFGLYTMDGAGNITTEMINGKLIPIHLPDYFIGAQAQWEIDVWGKLRNLKKAAMSRFLSSLEARKLIQTQLVADISQAYYALLALDNQLEIIDENIRLQENALELVQVQKEAGRSTELAIKQFVAQVFNLRGLRQEALQQMVEQENLINFWIGRYPQPIARQGVLLSLNHPAQVLSGTPAQLLQNRPDIKQAELELLASKADLNAARAAFYPRVDLNGSLGLQAFRPDLLVTRPQSIVYGLFAGLTAPLFNKRAIQSEFNYASAYQQEALLQYQQTILRAYTEVATTVAGLYNLDEVYQLKNAEATALQESIGISTDLFRTNRATYLEILFAQQNALQTRLELVEVKKRQFDAAINVYRALGGGWR
jgi:NodT family efflux transporter outer membrane factor (OMF) lipoprotein